MQRDEQSSVDHFDTRLAAMLAAGVLCIYLATARFFIDNTDGENMFLATEALLRGDVWLGLGLAQDWRKVWGWDGPPYLPHGLGQPIAAIPFYLAGEIAARLAPAVSPAIIKRAAVTTSVPLVSAWLVGLLYWFIRQLGYARREAALAAATYGLATMAWPYAKYFFSEPLAALLALAVLYYIWHGARTGHVSFAFVAGSLAGFMGLTRHFLWAICGLYFAAMMLAWPRRTKLAALTVFAAAVAPSAFLVAWYNWARFGSPLVFDPVKPVEFSLSTLPVGLAGQLFSPGKSIFLYSPAVLIALIGWPRFWRRHPKVAKIAAAVVVARLIGYSMTNVWHGSWCWGPRMMLPNLPLLWLAFAEGLRLTTRRRWSRAAVAAVIAVSFAVQVLAVCVFYMAHLDRLQQRGLAVSATYFHWRHSPLLGAVETLRRIRWTPIGRDALKVSRSNEARESLKTELRYTLDLWPAYLRRFGFPAWVWAVFAALLAAGCALLGAAFAAAGPSHCSPAGANGPSPQSTKSVRP